MTSEVAAPVLTDGAIDARRGRRPIATVVVGCLASVSLIVLAPGTPLPFVGWYGLSSLVTAGVIVAHRPGGRHLAVGALAMAVLLLVTAFAVRVGAEMAPFDRDHDGGVLATEAAARAALRLENPYVADFTDDLAPHHHTLDPVGGRGPNPLTQHFPYLPAAFLVHAPLTVLGAVFDPRIVYVAVAGSALAVVALSGSASSPRRAAALIAIVANGAIAAYLPWGANDTAAAGLVVLGAFAVPRRPLLAGALLALGISMKALLVVALVPLGVLWLIHDRRSAWRVLGATMVVLGATCGPYLLASPSAFVEDTVRFNLGLTELSYPDSGVGLGALFPQTVRGGLLFGLSAALVVGSSLGVAWWVRRAPHVEVGLFGAGLIVFAGLLPARSFQVSYAPLFVFLMGPIWRLSIDHWSPFPLVRSTTTEIEHT